MSAELHRSGFRQWGYEVTYKNSGVAGLFWCDPGQGDQVAQAKAARYREAGHAARLMCREVGPLRFFDQDQYAEPNEHGRCRSCDGTTGVCQKCRKPMHGPEAGHPCSALPCRNCNGGAYPVRLAATERESGPKEGWSRYGDFAGYIPEDDTSVHELPALDGVRDADGWM